MPPGDQDSNATDPRPIAEVTSRPQIVARLVMTVALVALGLWTLREFIPALVWAVILAIAVWPLYMRLRERVPPGRHNILLPALFTAGIALLFIVPLVLLAVRAGKEAHVVLDWIDSARKNGIPAPDFLSHLPFGGPQATTWWNDNLGDKAATAELLHRFDRAELVVASREFGAGLIHRVILFGFSLMTLFFVLRDGEWLAAQMERAGVRAFGPNGERIGRQIVASVHGTVDGLVLVGLGEGVVLGIAYAVTGVPHATLCGAVTAVAATIPFGAPLVFGVAALLLVGQGSAVAAIVVVAIGMVVTFVADHFIRPVLIGGATKLPFLWVLFGILGGVTTWGLLGLFLGPALMAALMMLWREWTGGQDE